MAMDKYGVESILSEGDEPLRLLEFAASQGCTLQDLASTWTRGDITLLMLAAKYGRTKCCELLIDANPSCMNLSNRQKYTALHFSSFGGNAAMSLALLRAGCHPLAVNKYGETCSEAAWSGGHVDLSCAIKMEVLRPPRVAAPVGHGMAITSTPACSVDNVQLVRRSGAIGQTRLMSSESQEGSYGVVSGASADSAASVSSYQRALSSKSVLEVVDLEAGADQSLLGCMFDLPASEAKDIFIGRGSTNNFNLKDLSISKQHAVVSYHTGLGYVVTDLNSVHGTYINGTQVQPQRRFRVNNLCISDLCGADLFPVLNRDDVLKLGRLTLAIRDRIEPTVLSSRYYISRLLHC